MKRTGVISFFLFLRGGELEFIAIHFDFLLTKNWWQQKCLLQKVCLYDEQNNITSFCSTTVVCTMAELFLAFFTFPTHTNTASNSRHCPYQIPEFGKKIQFNPNSLLEISFTPKKSNSLLCPPSWKLIYTKKNKNACGGIPSDQRPWQTSLAAVIQMHTKQRLSERAPHALRKSRPSVLRSQSIARPDSLSQRKRWTTSVYLFPLLLSFLFFFFLAPHHAVIAKRVIHRTETGTSRLWATRNG